MPLCDVVGCYAEATQRCHGQDVCAFHEDKMRRPGGYESRYRKPALPDLADDVEAALRATKFPVRLCLTGSNNNEIMFEKSNGLVGLGVFESLVALAEKWQRQGDTVLTHIKLTNGDVSIDWDVKDFKG